MPAHSSLDGPSPSSSLLQSPLPRPEDQKENSAGEYYTTASHTFKEYYSLHHQEPRHQENMDPLQGIYHGDRPFTPYDLVPNPERTYTSTPTSGASHSRPILRRKPGERRLNGIARNGEGQVSPTPSGCLTACSGGGGGGGGDSSGSGGTAGKERASLGGGGQQPSDTGDKSSRSGNNRGKEESSRDKSNDGSSGNNRAKPGLSAPTFKCPVACKARESDNVPKECRETFDTEQDAIDHCEQLHYLCPICKHAPPVQRDRKHSTLKTRPIIWRHYYFADTMGLKSHICDTHLKCLPCQFGCGDKFFHDRCRDEHEAGNCRHRSLGETGKQPGRALPPAVEDLHKQVKECIRRSSRMTKPQLARALGDILLDQRLKRGKKYDAMELHDEISGLDTVELDGIAPESMSVGGRGISGSTFGERYNAELEKSEDADGFTMDFLRALGRDQRGVMRDCIFTLDGLKRSLPSGGSTLSERSDRYNANIYGGLPSTGIPWSKRHNNSTSLEYGILTAEQDNIIEDANEILPLSSTENIHPDGFHWVYPPQLGSPKQSPSMYLSNNIHSSHEISQISEFTRHTADLIYDLQWLPQSMPTPQLTIGSTLSRDSLQTQPEYPLDLFPTVPQNMY